MNLFFYLPVASLNGIQCEGYGTYMGEKLLTEIWVNKDVPVSFGPHSAFDTPGLVVKAINYNHRREYLLNTFEHKKQETPVSFWPEIFNKIKFEIN